MFVLLLVLTTMTGTAAYCAMNVPTEKGAGSKALR